MYYSDKPIYSNSDDRLGRHSFSKLLAQSLLNLNSPDTFTIGLYGKWGSGKTSIVNMMLQELETHEKKVGSESPLIVVHFEPWNFSNTDQLLTQFFIRLSNELRSIGDKRLEKIGDALERYSGALDWLGEVPHIGKILSFVGKKGVSVASKKLKKGSGEKDISKQKEFVISLLKEQPNRILVVIDDIDRLDNEQIRQVFQLVTSVAKFPNTIYLLVFDRDVVVKALEKVQEGDGEDYLEKIIQMPIQMPEVRPARLRQVLLDQLNSIRAQYAETGFQQSHWQELYEPCIEPFVDSLRTVNRLCNTVQFKMAGIAAEIDFTDLVSLSAIELQFPEVYEWIRENKIDLSGGFDISYFVRQNWSQKDWYEHYSSKLRDLLNGRKENEKENQLETIITAISYLFPHFGGKTGKGSVGFNSNLLRKNNRIGHPEKFDRYFCFTLDEVAVKKSEVMSAAFELNYEGLIELIKKKDNEGVGYEFLEEIQAITNDLSSERAKIIVSALLGVAYRLDARSQENMLSLRASDFAEHMTIELLDRIDPEERFQFICSIVSSGDSSVVQSVAAVINMLELGYGRLAANGEERGYKKVITLEELLRVETVFTERVKQILSECNLFDLDRWWMVYYLLEQFDAKYAKAYLETALTDDVNVVKYIAGAIHEWSGGGTEYEVTDSYKQYLTDERILQAIETVKESGKLYLLSEAIQNKCAAFYLKVTTEERNYRGHIPKSATSELLSQWKR